MAPGFHDRTSRMLGETAGAAADLPPELIRGEPDGPLPRAFLEWAAAGGGAIMERHGPGDEYWFGPGGQGTSGQGTSGPGIAPVAGGADRRRAQAAAGQPGDGPRVPAVGR